MPIAMSTGRGAVPADRLYGRPLKPAQDAGELDAGCHPSPSCPHGPRATPASQRALLIGLFPGPVQLVRCQPEETLDRRQVGCRPPVLPVRAQSAASMS